jgi:hypothetical protein
VVNAPGSGPAMRLVPDRRRFPTPRFEGACLGFLGPHLGRNACELVQISARRGQVRMPTVTASLAFSQMNQCVQRGV